MDAGLPLVETVLKVRELGGVCIVPHPMAGGMGMKSLSKPTILKALRNPQVAETLIGIETYNGTSIDRKGNLYAFILACQLDITQTGSSDAHIIDTIGFGATQFDGKSAADLLIALKNGRTTVRRQKEWSAFKVLSSWGMRYMGSAFVRMIGLARA